MPLHAICFGLSGRFLGLPFASYSCGVYTIRQSWRCRFCRCLWLRRRSYGFRCFRFGCLFDLRFNGLLRWRRGALLWRHRRKLFVCFESQEGNRLDRVSEKTGDDVKVSEQLNGFSQSEGEVVDA